MASLPAECATAFGTFMATIRRTMQRSLDIRCRRCPLVGADEEAMLRILGATPAGDRLAAHEALSTWLATEGVMPAIDAAGRFMALLGAHGIELRYPPLAMAACASIGEDRLLSHLLLTCRQPACSDIWQVQQTANRLRCAAVILSSWPATHALRC